MYRYFLWFLELWGFQGVQGDPWLLVCHHSPECQGFRSCPETQGGLGVLAHPGVEVGTWDIHVGTFRSNPFVLCLLCAWVCVHRCVCMGVCAWVCVHGCVCMDVCAWVCVHGCVCMGVCAWVCVYGCVLEESPESNIEG